MLSGRRVGSFLRYPGGPDLSLGLGRRNPRSRRVTCLLPHFQPLTLDALSRLPRNDRLRGEPRSLRIPLSPVPVRTLVKKWKLLCPLVLLEWTHWLLKTSLGGRRFKGNEVTPRFSLDVWGRDYYLLHLHGNPTTMTPWPITTPLYKRIQISLLNLFTNLKSSVTFVYLVLY